MPKTPKKFAHKVPTKPKIPETVRIIDFDMNSSASEMPPPPLPINSGSFQTPLSQKTPE